MTQSPRSHNRFRVAQLNPRQPTAFVLTPDADARAAIATELSLTTLPALRFSGEINPVANDAWEVTGQLSAKVVQPCVVSLAPVKTTINEPVHRVLSPHAIMPEAEEVEMGDEEVDPLGQFIDVEAMMIEALALALPLYPRAEGAALDTVHDPDDAETRKPFAGLADLLRNRNN